MGQTNVQKILAKATGRTSVDVGEIVEPRVDLAMSHETAHWLLINS
jgi:homoaconitase/3-isopropylmalate dehydratase large subunit